MLTLCTLQTSTMEGASPSPDASFMSAGDASFVSPSDAQEQLEEQNRLIGQLKSMIRQRDKELTETNAKLSKVKLQAKAKIVSLNTQVEELKKKSSQGGDSAEKTPEVLLFPLYAVCGVGGSYFCFNMVKSVIINHSLQVDFVKGLVSCMQLTLYIL